MAPRAARVRLCANCLPLDRSLYVLIFLELQVFFFFFVRELTAAAVAVRKENNMRARDICKSVPARATLHAGALSAD